MVKRRTVFALVILAIIASSAVTFTLAETAIFPGTGALAGSEAGGLTKQEMEKINTVFKLVQTQYIHTVDREKVVDGAIDGMLNVLEDPYTVYMDKEENEQFEDMIESSFTGIGAEVSLVDGKVTVVSPLKGSPAEKAGIQARDVILSVNGEKLENLSLQESIMKIRGPKGTKARLEILRPGMTEPIEIVVVRDEIDLETVFSTMLNGGIGKIEILQFAQNTAKRFAEELERLEKQGMKALIIDVRNNPGGLLYSVVDIAELFLPKGKVIVQVEDRNGERKKTLSHGSGRHLPVAVLINKGSASASEILAAALQESYDGKLFGEATFGKGTVQTTFEEFGDGSNIKMTIAKWLTPNGRWIDKKGIEPDVAVEPKPYFKAGPIPKDSELKREKVGDGVRNVQIILEGLGLDPGRKDGYFGKETEQAVKAFQRLNGLPMTGIIDEKTARKMEERILEEIQKPENDRQLNEAIRYLQKRLASPSS